MSQHWFMILLGAIACVLVYCETYLLDKMLIVKFGEDYKIYKTHVPRINIIFGLLKRINKKKRTKLNDHL